MMWLHFLLFSKSNTFPLFGRSQLVFAFVSIQNYLYKTTVNLENTKSGKICLNYIRQKNAIIRENAIILEQCSIWKSLPDYELIHLLIVIFYLLYIL
jgi:hypothetical protein